MEENSKHPVDEKKVNFRLNLLNSKREGKGWTLIIIVMSFIISVSLSLLSTETLKSANNLVSFIVLFIIIFINIMFDIVGTAVTAADEAPFHAMASRKLYGAKQAIYLIRNADKVSNFANDVVGDICGIISGTATGIIILGITGVGAEEITITALAITGMVASCTVGGKALGKSIAIENSNYIIYRVAIIINFFAGKFLNKKKRNSKKNKKNKKK